MTARSGPRTVEATLKGVIMGVAKWAGLLLIGAVTVAGCGDDDDGSIERSGAITTIDDSSGASPTTAASDAQPTGVLFHDPLDDDRNGWGVVDDPDYGSTTFDGGDYVWEFTGSAAHVLPTVLGDQYDRGELDMLDVVVHAEATLLTGGGVLGVFCRETPDTDAEWQWYEFVVRDGFAAIRLTDSEGNIEDLATTEDLAVPAGEPIALDATCTDDEAGNAQLALTVNGDPVLTATDSEPLGNGAPGLQAWTFPLHEQMDIRWHEFSVEAAANS